MSAEKNKNNKTLDFNLILNLYMYSHHEDYIYMGANKKSIQEKIKRYLKKFLTETKKESWKELSESQKDYFIAQVLYAPLASKRDTVIQNQIRERLNKYIKNQLSDLHRMEERKQIDIYKEYCVENSFPYQRDNAYDVLCEDMKKYNPLIPLPTREEYRENPMRIYDYEMNWKESLYYRNRVEEFRLQIIERILEKELGLIIHEDAIMECLKEIDSIDYSKFTEEVESERLSMIKRLDNRGIPIIEETDEPQEKITMHFDLDSLEQDGFPPYYEDNMGISEKEYNEVKEEYYRYRRCVEKIQNLTNFYELKPVGKKKS